MQRLCFVVVNYFSHQKVAALIESIAPVDGVFGIIVDNSNDNSEFAALSSIIARDDVECLQSDRNGGFSYGTNLGLKAALKRADAFLILNPDTKVAPDFFQALLDIRTALPDVAVSPHGLHMTTGRIWSAGGAFYWLRGRADVLTGVRRSGETDFGTCACLMVPKAALDDIGLLDEDFFLGGEEWDFSLRLRKKGWRIIYSSRAVYLHEVSGTHEKYGRRFFYVGMRTKVLFARKHYGVFFWPWLFFFMLPSVPVILWRNSRLNHGNIQELAPLLCFALVRSIRKQPMTQREYVSEGKHV
ncbi:MAG: glycosyltransferase [Gammaproteobacteria bacterium]|nr:glycosyltransferase [Gammaproteobacteria bacterium]MBU1838160.1 glycosyltransferase [Alphaproteobacteria bacterium]